MSGWLGAIRRYLIVPAAGFAAALAVVRFAPAAFPEFARADNGLAAPTVLYAVPSVLWITFAVLERTRIIWRLLLTWAPAAPIVLLIVFSMLHPIKDNWDVDGQGMALMIYVEILLRIAVLCVLGSIAVLIYRAENPRAVSVDEV